MMIGLSLGIALFVIHWTMVLVERNGKNLWRLKVKSLDIKGPYQSKTSYHKTFDDAASKANRYSTGNVFSIEHKSLLTGEWN